MEPTVLHFLILTVGGWMNRRQADAIEYLLEENRLLREHLAVRSEGRTPSSHRGIGPHG